MRITEFWTRMETHLGPTYARSWAQDQVLAELDGRTVVQAMDAGTDAKTVWRAVHHALRLPPADR